MKALKIGAMPALLAVWLLAPTAALAQVDSGDTAWIITATALVLFMTLPGLALFYGGLVRVQNVLSVLVHCAVIACLVSVLWLVAGYSLAFTDGGGANALIGGFSKAFLNGVSTDSTVGTIPENVFFMFQMTFAIITPALIVGAYPERVTFPMVVAFSVLWLFLVYVPVCHWVWGGGWLAEKGVIDFAGGLVVHATAGTSALVFAILLGRRQGFPGELTPPHSPTLTFIGAAMLWVGWFGFNAGSALGANGDAGLALTNTHLSCSMAALVWMTVEWLKFGKPSLVGVVTGMIAGLATITPAAGSVGPTGALVIGALAGSVCFICVQAIKQNFKIDDSLDVFAVHGVGGILGTLIAPLLASFGPMSPGLDGVSVGAQFGVQAMGVVAVCVWSAIATVVIVKLLSVFIKLRVSDEVEHEGLDISIHGERGYNLMQ